MFSQDFYPTPAAVIEQMTAEIEILGKVFLEPSAGKGNIIDFLKKNGAKKVICCEQHPELAKIVSQKAGFIAHDFLKVRSEHVSHIDYIVMNPPFSDDERHILHAWEIAPAGCEIVSLCNENTLRNSYSESRRKILKIINN
jgi:predicted RNA methylase